MTTQHVNEFVTGLAQMALAVEENPKLQAEIERLQALVASQEYELRQREAHIESLRNSYTEVSEKLRSVEAERDNAGFRQLAAEDALESIKRSMQTAFHNFGETLKAIQPEPVQEPVPQPISMEFTTRGGEMHVDEKGNATFMAFGEPTGQSDSVPTTPVQTTATQPEDAGSGTVHSTVSASFDEHGDTQGQRAADPTVSSATSSPADAPTPVGERSARPQDAVTGVDIPTHDKWGNRFRGKLYMLVPGYYSRKEWLEGGGTDATYDWKEGHPIPSEAA